MQSGAAGVDMGRNIFQSEHPVAVIRAVRAIVHEGMSPSKRAFYEYHSCLMEAWDGPAEAMLGTMTGGTAVQKMWDDPVTENPTQGATEVWELHNSTADAHPMHVHEITFEVVNRQAIGDAPRPPEAWELGFKDTVIAYPGEITRIRAKFDSPGQFVWHCHIVEHEDNEMMRPYRIGPVQPGQPE